MRKLITCASEERKRSPRPCTPTASTCRSTLCCRIRAGVTMPGGKKTLGSKPTSSRRSGGPLMLVSGGTVHEASRVARKSLYPQGAHRTCGEENRLRDVDRRRGADRQSGQ